MLNIYNPNQQPDSQDSSRANESQPPTKKADFNRYVDTGGDFSNKELVYSFWWVKHKVLFYRLGLVLLIGLNAVLYIYNVGLWGQYLLGITDDRRLELYASRFQNYSGFVTHFSPAPIDIVSTNIFKSGEDKYDAVAVINNPNTKFVADVDYRFILNSTSTELFSTKILANQSGLLAALGLPEDVVGTGEIILNIEKINWKRIDNHVIPDLISWQDERINFTVSDIKFQSAFTADSLGANRLEFKLKNSSAFSYKTPSFLVALYNGDVLAGVMTAQTENFLSGEEKLLDLRNFAPNLQVTNLKVFPQINIYDSSVILSPES